MRVRMLETRRGTEDGFAIRLFEQGREYEMGDFLARQWIAAGRAQAVTPQKDTLQPSEKE